MSGYYGNRIHQIPEFISAVVLISSQYIRCPGGSSVFSVLWERACSQDMRYDTAGYAAFDSVSVKRFECIWKETDRLSAICGTKLNLRTFWVDLCLYQRLKWLRLDDFSGYWWWLCCIALHSAPLPFRCFIDVLLDQSFLFFPFCWKSS